MISSLYFLPGVFLSGFAIALVGNADTPVLGARYYSVGWVEHFIVGWLPSGATEGDPGPRVSYRLRHSPDDHRGQVEMYTWMARIPNDRKLSSLSIPGTHSSMQWSRNESSGLRAQNFPLSQQLQSGIRYVDILLREGEEKPSKLYAADEGNHGDWAETYASDHMHILSAWPDYDTTLLKIISDFLELSTTETVLVRLRRDPKDNKNPEASEKSFADAFGRHIEKIKENSHLLGRMLRHDGGFKQLPSLGESRGKFLLLFDFKGSEAYADYGIPWTSDLLSPDKHFEHRRVNCTRDIELKWSDMNRHIEKAQRSSGGNKLFVSSASAMGPDNITYELVATGGSKYLESDNVMEARNPNLLPAPGPLHRVVKGGRLDVKKPKKTKERRTVQGMNELLYRKMKQMLSTPGPKTAGVVVMDFPGADLVSRIVDLNSQ